MKTLPLGYSRSRNVMVLATCLMATFSLAACAKSGSGASAATDGNAANAGPPVINAAFGARLPRKCNPVNHLPNEGEAAALLQCAMDTVGNYFPHVAQGSDSMPSPVVPAIYLWQNVHVQMGGSRPYAHSSDFHYTSIDKTSEVYPIRVTADQLTCTGKSTCITHHADKAEGICYKTTFGDWNCYFEPDLLAANPLPAPKTY